MNLLYTNLLTNFCYDLHETYCVTVVTTSHVKVSNSGISMVVLIAQERMMDMNHHFNVKRATRPMRLSLSK
jgi:hypothetical protein